MCLSNCLDMNVAWWAEQNNFLDHWIVDLEGKKHSRTKSSAFYTFPGPGRGYESVSRKHTTTRAVRFKNSRSCKVLNHKRLQGAGYSQNLHREYNTMLLESKNSESKETAKSKLWYWKRADHEKLWKNAKGNGDFGELPSQARFSSLSQAKK